MSRITLTEYSSASWLALVIGNSRLHWAWFVDDKLQERWDTPHLQSSHPLPLSQVWQRSARGEVRADEQPDLWIASVVPAQSKLWESYPHIQFLSLEQIPLKEMYPTLGVDRALAVWGAIATIGSPVLVIDAGTALTFTGADTHHQLIGGAILPGLRLQFQVLNQETAALPFVKISGGEGKSGNRGQGSGHGEFPLPTPHSPLPTRWALNTTDAIASGILYTLLAGLHEFINAWWQLHPASSVVLTGGDGDRLHHSLQQHSPALAEKLSVDPNLIFWGIRAVRNGNKIPDP